MLKTVPVTREYAVSPADLAKIREIAGNTELTDEDLFLIGPFVIARSGPNRNHTDITPEAQRSAVDKWIGKAILSKDHESKTENQIARIYRTAIEDGDGVTVTKGWAYAVQTSDHADLFARIKNGIHKEMSCAYDLIHSVCSQCGSSLEGPQMTDCPQGHRLGVDGVHARDLEIEPDHVSFVARPAVEGAGVVAHSDNEIRTDGNHLLARDGMAFRQWAVGEFAKHLRANMPTTTQTEVEDLCSRLSAIEMIRLARIEERRFHEVVPDGKQITQAAPNDDDREEPRLPEYDSVQDIFKKGT